MLLLNKMEVMFVKPFVIFFAVDGLIATDVMSFQWSVARRKSFKQSARERTGNVSNISLT